MASIQEIKKCQKSRDTAPLKGQSNKIFGCFFHNSSLPELFEFFELDSVQYQAVLSQSPHSMILLH